MQDLSVPTRARESATAADLAKLAERIAELEDRATALEECIGPDFVAKFRRRVEVYKRIDADCARLMSERGRLGGLARAAKARVAKAAAEADDMTRDEAVTLLGDAVVGALAARGAR